MNPVADRRAAFWGKSHLFIGFQMEFWGIDWFFKAFSRITVVLF
jgi:hypothetical protein